MPYAPGQTTGYNSIGDYLDANRATLANERADLRQDVSGQLDAAKAASDKVIADTPGPVTDPAPEQPKNPYAGHSPDSLIDDLWARQSAQWDKDHPAPPPPKPHVPDNFDPTKVAGYDDALSKQSSALENAGALSSIGGTANVLSQHFGYDPAKDPANSATYFDAQLLGTGGYGDVHQKAQSLSDYLDKGVRAKATPPPPAAPAPTPTQEPVPTPRGNEDGPDYRPPRNPSGPRTYTP